MVRRIPNTVPGPAQTGPDPTHPPAEDADDVDLLAPDVSPATIYPVSAPTTTTPASSVPPHSKTDVSGTSPGPPTTDSQIPDSQIPDSQIPDSPGTAPTADPAFASLRAVEILADLVAGLPDAEERPGQTEMASLVADAAANRHHLMVEAGTGVGKSFAYLAGLLGAGTFPAVISTATKALQDQLSAELPAVVAHADRNLSAVTIKGRQSYVCPAKVQQKHPSTFAALNQMSIGDFSDDFTIDAGTLPQNVVKLMNWLTTDPAANGERDHAPATFTDDEWMDLSISGMECPGSRCPFKDVCPAMKSLNAAKTADIIITNHHLYAAHLSAGLSVLPHHEVVVFDEAHKLPDTLMSGMGITLTPRRMKAFAGLVAAGLKNTSVPPERSRPLIAATFDAASHLEEYLNALPPGSVTVPIAAPHDQTFRTAASTVKRALAVLSNASTVDNNAATHRTLQSTIARAESLAAHIIADIESLLAPSETIVAWSNGHGVLRSALVDVADPTADWLLTQVPTILCSATLTLAGSFEPFADRLGYTDLMNLDDLYTPADTRSSSDEYRSTGEDLPPGTPPAPRLACTYYATSVETPFNYGIQGLLYVPALPKPQDAAWPDATDAMIREMLSASGGRALILTTSFAAVNRIASSLRTHPEASDFGMVLAQGQFPRSQLVQQFMEDERSSLVATMGFWEGLDIPGRSLEMVIVDRIPFPRPDDPLFAARRNFYEKRGKRSFAYVDLPRAATLLAQGTGRLIRNTTDEGVVVICDSRLVSARYGRTLIESLPAFTGTQDHREVISRLNRLRDM